MPEFPPLTPPIDATRAPPFHEMSEHPKRFERLSAQLLGREPAIETAQLYGINGEEQRGADILVKRRAGAELEVASCKCYSKISASGIQKASEEFLRHWDESWAKRNVRRFTLVTSALNVTSTKVQAQIETEIERFRDLGITFDVWGPEELTDKLQKHRDIASRFLSEEWARILCGENGREAGVDRSGEYRERNALTIRELTSGFVGREYLFSRFDEFIAGNEAGYIILQASPGEGKSAIAAQYAIARQAFVHFNSLGEGINTPAHFAASLLEQYTTAFGREQTDRLARLEPERIVAQIFALLSERSRDQKVAVVVDAWDEVEMPASKPLANILYLPDHLPKNVFVIGTSRPIRTRLMSHSSQSIVTLSEYAARSRGDIETFIERWCSVSHEVVLKLRLEEKALIEAVVGRSENNFMYVKYVLSDLKAGRLSLPKLDDLPLGLVQYYNSHWKRMGMEDLRASADKLNVLYVLAHARRPISAELIARMVERSVVAVQSVLTEWSQFLRADRREGSHLYSLYHQSFRDFLTDEPVIAAAGLDLKAVHARIADGLWNDIVTRYLPL